MTPEQHAAAAREILLRLGSHDLVDNVERAVAAVWIQEAQVHATLATVKPPPPAPDMVDSALYYEAERERELAVAKVHDLQRILDRIRDQLGAYGQAERHANVDLVDAVGQLMEQRYNSEPAGEPDVKAWTLPELSEQLAAFLAAHEPGGYSDRTIEIRRDKVRQFFAYLSGKFNPATDKHLRVAFDSEEDDA